ncbi:MAG: hypothetical protein SP1CHLAM54_05150 [Chlamydiia bacterium]|nr:hypothetical protein [Chlamydiia bacterium]MCH9615427.1 hypothetical protein [Chlamydiia bacterium]MCH9628251.1 hypothetical protein [Chlamydiia bacterium]
MIRKSTFFSLLSLAIFATPNFEFDDDGEVNQVTLEVGDVITVQVDSAIDDFTGPGTYLYTAETPSTIQVRCSSDTEWDVPNPGHNFHHHKLRYSFMITTDGINWSDWESDLDALIGAPTHTEQAITYTILTSKEN